MDGHRADGQRVELTGPGGGPIRVEVAAALKKIYGKPLPGEVAAPPAYVDVEEINTKHQTPSSKGTDSTEANEGSEGGRLGDAALPEGGSR